MVSYYIKNEIFIPFRFREGLSTLGVLEACRNFPNMKAVFVDNGAKLTASDVIDVYTNIEWSPVGSNRRNHEELVVAYFRDYLLEAECNAFAYKMYMSN